MKKMKKMKKVRQTPLQRTQRKKPQLDYTVEVEEKSILFKDEIEELFSLCMQAMNATNYVAFEINNCTKYASIVISDEGLGAYDQCYYDIHFNNEMAFGETSRRAYQEAKEHLLRILEVVK